VVLREDISSGFSVCDEFDWTQTRNLWNTESEGRGGVEVKPAVKTWVQSVRLR